MHIILALCFAILSMANAQLDDSKAGTSKPPWYWKPNTKPNPVYTTPEPWAQSRIDIGLEAQPVKSMAHWYEEYEQRKNRTDGPGDIQRPKPDAPIPSAEPDCPRDVIHDQLGGRGYFFSWEDPRSQKLRMTWPQAVNFCRARCLELVSILSRKEEEFLIKHIIAGKEHGVWTSGRKCDFRGCEKQEDMQPADIYGWFWEGSRVQLPPTTDRFDGYWSHTGPLGKPQPDNSEGKRGGERESCLAILNNKYKDGVAWHDEPCSKRKPFICEEPRGYNRPKAIDADAVEKEQIVPETSARHSFQYQAMGS